MHVMINQYVVFLICSVFIDDWVSVCGALERVQIFS